MPISEIAIAIRAVKSAIAIGKNLVSAGSAVETATLRLQMSELMMSLADAQIALAAAQGMTDGLQQEVRRLNDVLEPSFKVVEFGSAYFEMGDHGHPKGDPYCMRCWEVERKLRHLSRPNYQNQPVECATCNAKYGSNEIIRLS